MAPELTAELGEPFGRLWGPLEDLELATLEWVDWFNHRRLSSAIGYVPPAEYEASSIVSPSRPPPDSMNRVSMKPGAVHSVARVGNMPPSPK